MATTIMISTNVKPDLREVLFFILTLYLSVVSRRELATGGLILLHLSFTYCPLQPHRNASKLDANRKSEPSRHQSATQAAEGMSRATVVRVMAAKKKAWESLPKPGL